MMGEREVDQASRNDNLDDMKEVFTTADSALVGLYQSALEDAGIASFVDNFHNLEIPPFCHPRLCVLNDGDFEAAMQIVTTIRDRDVGTVREWKCRHCMEMVPANFTNCWNCDLARSWLRFNESTWNKGVNGLFGLIDGDACQWCQVIEDQAAFV